MAKPLKLPYKGECGELVIPFDSPKHFHWWKMKDDKERAEAFRQARFIAGIDNGID